MDAKLIARYNVREAMGLVVMGVALFWPAGSMDWCAGWAAIAVMLIWTVATAVIILRYRPDLLAERLGPRKGAKSWDITIMSFLGLVQLARYIVAGFDHRYGWSSGIPSAAQLAGLLVSALGYVLVIWATARNPFFSQIVRVQHERSQFVVTDGPYRFVRHPSYAGAILFELAVPFLLASWWSLALSGVNVLLLILRTALEDRALQMELGGYREYAGRVAYRLLPGVW